MKHHQNSIKLSSFSRYSTACRNSGLLPTPQIQILGRRKLVQSQGKSRISSCLWQPFIYLQWVWTTPSSEKNKSPFIPWIFELQPIRRPLTLLPAALQFSSPLQRRCVLDAQRRSSDLKSFHMRIFAIFLLVLKGWPKRALPSWAPSFTH